MTLIRIQGRNRFVFEILFQMNDITQQNSKGGIFQVHQQRLIAGSMSQAWKQVQRCHRQTRLCHHRGV